MNVKLIKLTSGDEFIAELIDDNENHALEFKNAVRFAVTQEGPKWVPLSLFAKQGQQYSILQEHIIFMAEPDEEIVNSYKQQFSGIITPPSRIIV